MIKKVQTVLLVLLVLFSVNPVVAASNVRGVNERIDLVMYDMNEHTYFAYAYDEQNGSVWQLSIETRGEFDQHELDELQSVYDGLHTYIEYDSNGGSSNYEDWTLTGWSVVTGK